MQDREKSQWRLITVAIMAVILLILTMTIVRFKNIRGNELGIMESWQNGVEEKVYQPGMHWLFPAWSHSLYVYDASVQKFIMNSQGPEEGEHSFGRAKDVYRVESAEGQQMDISMNLQWHRSQSKLVVFHRKVGQEPEEKVIRPVLMRVVKDEATQQRAIDAYSGPGLVALQKKILDDLRSSVGDAAKFAEYGIEVDNFVIEHIELDPSYIAEIKGKQVAQQKTLRSAEEQKAADAQALVAKALAQADLNKQVVEAERDKQITVLKAQAANEQVTLAAEAEQKKRVMEAEGKRDADIAEAKGILAIGEAKANANKLMLQSYSVPGSELFARVEVAKQVAVGFQNVKGYLPNVNSINMLGGNFDDLVSRLAGAKGATSTSLSEPIGSVVSAK